MKYLLLPIHLLKFWYIESLVVLARSWKNTISFLEEDLAVGLMVKLLFIPLFHDASWVGRILSFFFRLSRIVMGLFAFGLASMLIFLASLVWLLAPMVTILGGFIVLPFQWLIILSPIVLFSGVGLFLIHTFTHPHKKIWETKDVWQCSQVTRKNLTWSNLLKSYEVVNLLAYLEIDISKLSSFEISDVETLSAAAFELAKKSNSQYLNSAHFFVASLRKTANIENYLLKLNLEMVDLENALKFLEKKNKTWRKVWIWDAEFAIKHLRGINRGWLGVPTPSLDMFSEDLTRAAAKGQIPDFVGRSGVVSEVINILSQEGKRNVILVGPPGCGKSALVKFLAKQILAGNAPPALATKRLVELDLTKLLSGAQTQGELAERVKNIFEEVKYAGNIILAVEEIQDLGVGQVGEELNLYSLMLPYLDSDQFQFIATTEPASFARTLERQGAFARLFTKIEILPANLVETVQILEDRAIEMERGKAVKVSYLSLKKIAELSDKYIKNRVLPDSALDILGEAQVLAKDGWVNSKVVEEVMSKKVNVPLAQVGSVQKEQLLNMESEIHHRLIDQQQAVKVVADSLRRGAAGLREKNRPIGSFLFVGPTGVGKTELAKILAEEYFKGSGVFVRFDMSEYQTERSVDRLIGNSTGQLGQLTEAIRNKPYALLLLDEFEKADPKILTLFLQVLEDGRLTDASGNTVDFTNTIIIATSNAGSLVIAEGLGQGGTLDELKEEVNGELLKVFKPELVNRFDEVVLFKPLSSVDLQQIVRLKLRELQAQMKEQGYVVEFDEKLVAELTEKGFDPIMGARPLRRLIQDTLEAKLSKLILENKLPKGETFKSGPEMMLA